MILLLKIIILISIFLFFHCYLIYPLHLFILYSLRKKSVSDPPCEDENLPQVSCIISVYNESGIIDKKIISVLDSNYPVEKLILYIGSDASTDDSNHIIERWSVKDKRIHFFYYKQRRGKAFVINDLVDEAFKKNIKSDNHILLFTDANVILTKNAIKNLCRHFKNSKVALVDSKIIPTNLKEGGISYSENQYMSLEIKVKHMEGKLWGAMMGAFGGCFALRSSFLEKVPPRFLVDDFFISMSALKRGGHCLNDLNAICYEGMPDQLKEEFKRKARISAGNFQNLAYFYKMLFKKPVVIAYAFFSHKVLRWIGPFLIILMGTAMIGLAIMNPIQYSFYLLIFTIIIIVLPFIDYLLSKVGINIKILRGIRYFISMNIALLIGFIKYVKGIRNSSWEPPKRT